MEAIGAGASTLAFVLLALKSAKSIHESLSVIGDAPRTVRELTQDVQLLQTVLERLKSCSISHAPGSTVASLQDMLQTCTAELSSIETRLTQFLLKQNSSRSRRVYKGILCYVKKEELEDARNRIRDKTTQANLYLGLLQAQAISDTSSRIDTQASTTTGILEQILGEVGRLHQRLDNDTSTTTRDPGVAIKEDMAGAVSDDLEAMNLCSELEESISRLSSLADCDRLTLDADDAEQIVDDLHRFILMAKNKVSGRGMDMNTTREDGGVVRRDLKLVEGLILSAPIVAINQAVPNSNQLLACLPRNTVIKQKRLREEISVNSGLTISTTKRRRICRESEPNSSRNTGTHRDVVANITFRPSGSPWMFAVSVSQGQLFDRSIQSIPRISICPILPNDSLVFRLVQQGQLDDFRILLNQGKASLRDHDEQGMPLLHYAATGSVDMCKFLLESGADVDEMGEHSGTALSRIAGLGRHDTTLVLLENMADPTLSYLGWDNPLSTACSLDIESVELFLKHGGHFTLNDFESSDMTGRTRLHQICMADSRSTSKRTAVAMLVAAGARIDSQIGRSWSPDDHQTLGFTCLHSLVYTAHRTRDRDDLETLVFLIQRGADTLALDHHQNTVSMRAYLPNENDNYYTSKGSYRGDLWDAALAICGYDLSKSRASYPRVPRYNKSYTRKDFERLWLGNESSCPYWDNERYPEMGGCDDYWKQPTQRCGHTSCPEFQEHHAEPVVLLPTHVEEADLPTWWRSPTPSDSLWWYEQYREQAEQGQPPDEEYYWEEDYWEPKDPAVIEGEKFYDEADGGILPPSSEDGEAAYWRLMGLETDPGGDDGHEPSDEKELYSALWE
ncbi:hypothetical protein ACJ41O_001217 [Fusarium nematophilum]